MKYLDKLIYMEGIITAFDDASVSLDFKGRLGFLKIPRRMIITDYPLMIGQEVGFQMSYPEVISEEPSEHYQALILKRQQEDQ